MKIINLLIFFLSFITNAQNIESCNVQKSKFIDAFTVDKDDLICIAKNSSKPFTIFYTLTSWCSPCRIHFPDAVALEKSGQVNLFVILVEAEDDKKIIKAIDFIKSSYADVQFGVLKDESYGKTTSKRNNKFVAEITPTSNEVIDDYGKFILVDNSGKIVYVTNYKDYDKDWKNSQKMIENKILPLIKQ